MFEYILLLQICSLVNNSCLEANRYPKTFATHKECVVSGYQVGTQLAKSLPDTLTNQEKLYITFSCHEVERSDI